jgi:transcriptional regulator with XRE-family HTH domain
MADRYTEETLRLAGMLKTLAKSKRRSIRSIEQQMGVGTSIFHKVLKGDVTLHVRHVLMIAEALEIDWAEFFHMAYPRASAAPAASGASLLDDINHALGEPAEEELPDPAFEERVKRVLVHLGLISEDEADGELNEEKPRLRSA